jgi:hypothetical protein
LFDATFPALQQWFAMFFTDVQLIESLCANKIFNDLRSLLETILVSAGPLELFYCI